MNATSFIKNRILEEYGSIRRFAKKIDMPVSTLNTALNKENGFNSMGVESALKICTELGLDIEALYNAQNEPLTADEKKLVDIYQSISKRSKDFLIEFAENLKKYESKEVVTIMPMIDEGRIKTRQMDYYDMAAGMGSGQVIETSIPKKIEVALNNIPENADFIIRVYGDSMEPTFHSDDRLFIQRVESLSIGDIGVFSYQGEELVKEMGNGYLISHNKEYKPIFINGDDLFIQGKVVGKV